MQKYENVILGFTFLGAGAAISKPKGSLIIERTSLVGSEFVDSLNFKKCKNINLKTNQAKSLYSRLRKDDNISGDGSIYEFAALTEVSRMILESKVKVLFLTEIVEIRPGGGGYFLTIHNQEGPGTIFSKRILDTRAESAFCDETVRIETKKLLNSAAEGPELQENSLTGYKIFPFPAELDEDIISARSRLFHYLNSHDELRAHHVSSTFAFEMPQVKLIKGENYIIEPSCGYFSLLDAFDAGGIEA